MVDVGSGTGIASRQFASRGIRVIGIEPNAEMRRRAETRCVIGDGAAPAYRAGTAEATGLPDGIADAVLSAQAFHWFIAEAALSEFHRILKPHGWAALMWNERDETDPFAAAYGAALRTAPDAAEIEKDRACAGDALLQAQLFQNGKRVVFSHTQKLDEDGVLGRVFSTSYAPREPAAANALADALRTAFRRYQCGGHIAMRYVTSVYLAQRA
jgi:SAM-dependent methyltransferase